MFAIIWAWINFSWFASAYDADDWIYRAGGDGRGYEWVAHAHEARALDIGLGRADPGRDH